MSIDDLKLEVLKLATSEKMCAGNPAQALEAAKKLWEFFAPQTPDTKSEKRAP